MVPPITLPTGRDFSDEYCELNELSKTLQKRSTDLNKQIGNGQTVQELSNVIKRLNIAMILSIVAGCILGTCALVSVFTATEVVAIALAILSLITFIAALFLFIAKVIVEKIHESKDTDHKAFLAKKEEDYLQNQRALLITDIESYNRRLSAYERSS